MQNVSLFLPLKFVIRNALYTKTQVNSNFLNQCYNIISGRTKTCINSYINSIILRIKYSKLNYEYFKLRIFRVISELRVLLIFKAVGSIFSGALFYQYFEANLEPVKAAPKSYKELLKDADNLYDQQKFDELYELLIPEKDSNNDEILWRLARAVYEKSRRLKSAEEIKVLYNEALDYLEAANDINNNNFAVHKWLTIVKDKNYTLQGLKVRISHLYELKHHMERACKLKPNDGTSWHILGMWYFGIANISWYERKVASLFFATPPEATYEDALQKFLEAERVEPNFYSKNYLMIGKCLYYLGRKDEARTYFLKAKSYDGNTLDDQEAKLEAGKWL